MSAALSRLAVRPERCNRCGRCIRACPKALVRVTSGYVHIDSSACLECMACADVCQTGAISRRVIPTRPTAASSITSGDVPTVVVGSRAEAKALRRSAHDAEKQKAAAQKSTLRQAKVVESSAAIEAATRADGTALWTVADAVTILAVLAVSLIAKQAVLGSSAVEVMPAAGQVVARAIVLGGFYSVQLAALAYLASRHDMTIVQAFGLGRLGRSWGHRLTSVALVVVLFVATRAAALLWSAFARLIGWTPPVRADLTGVFGAGGAGLALSVVMVVVAAPVVEELVYRGILLRVMGRKWGMWPAVVGSATVFALSHATAWALVPTVVLGTALGWLAWTRDSLWPSIALHALYNAVVVAAAFWLAG